MLDGPRPPASLEKREGSMKVLGALGFAIVVAGCGGSDDVAFSTADPDAGGGDGTAGSAAGGQGGGTAGEGGAAAEAGAAGAGASGAQGGEGGGAAMGGKGGEAASGAAAGTAGSGAGGEAASAGSGVGGEAASGGNGAQGGAGGVAASGGLGGASGSGGGQGGAAGSAAGAAGTAGAGGGDACVPVGWCHDEDGDGYGSPHGMVTSCSAPGADWIQQGSKDRACSDCHDGNGLVVPNGNYCSGEWYQPESGVGTSYDYNCSGSETECGTAPKFEGCTLGAGACVGMGYLPNSDRPSSGADPSQNPYCGSDEFVPGCSLLSVMDGGVLCVPKPSVKYNPITCK
jgi:hypothetical protein